MEKYKNISLDYLFELIERISRFYIHLEEIKVQFYSGDDESVNDKLIFIQSYIDCLVKFLEISENIYAEIKKEEINEKEHFEEIKKLIISINKLHKNYLGYLPRPSEPVELKRFGRIIDKHVVNLNKVVNHAHNKNNQENSISIYLSEEVGESTYLKDPVFEFKSRDLNDYITSFNQKYQNSISKFKEDLNSIEGFHISIPRIDANNPCRWPTLMHEVAHKLYKIDYFNNNDIEKDFKNGLDKIQLTFIAHISSTINIRSWLIECWCDLFACLVTGPVFWFSQFSAFIFQEKLDQNEVDEYYPKALFRLTLIKRILEHRFPNIFSEELKNLIHSSEAILDTIDKDDSLGFNKNDDIRQLFLYFRVYFLNYFFNLENIGIQFDSKSLNKNLKPLIKYTQEINHITIDNLLLSICDGLPIPSKRINENSLIEKPTYIQEILLAAWMYRNNSFKKEIFNKFEANDASSGLNLLHSIVKDFDRFDKSILRSIQVSEWFDLLCDNDQLIENPKELLIKGDDYNRLNSSILCDFEIVELLKNNKLKIIPIINIEKQLGSTSFDIRLGTSFQLYLHTKYGVIDFSDSTNTNKIHNSKMIDLDFLEFVTISPGQFILGHSMEYLKLPSNIAGQVEGRSSFARLGLQIHMTAGFVDPGFEGVLTFEIYNAGPNPIKLFPGLRIAQLRFLTISKPAMPYNRNINAKYKGLLTHHDSMQFKDYEVNKIRNELNKE